MQKVLIAGATGLLGRHVLKELKQQCYQVRALTRVAARLRGAGADEILPADLTQPATLDHACTGMDYVISCAGAAMNFNAWGDRKSFYEVDYQGNLNLLAEAQRAEVKKFVYVSLAHAGELRQVEYADAHQRFVEALSQSGLANTAVCPTGFFGFLLEILKFAKKGQGMLIGDGHCRTNPIHEAEVARACVAALSLDETELNIGGPEVFTRKEIAELAFAVLQQPPRLRALAPGLFKALIWPLKLINPRIHALLDFGVAVTQIDCLAQAYGKERLQDYFAAAALTL